MSTRLSRRTLLTLTGAGVLGLAGCLDQDDEVTVDEGAAWQTTTLTDVTTGEEFTIGEFDAPVVVHTFETWCTSCQSQQDDLDVLHAQAGEDIEMVDLTIDDNYDPDDLAAYAADRDLEWRFGIAPGEVTRSLQDDFGERVATAPQSPVIVVCPDGEAVSHSKGVSADELADTIDDTCE